MSGLNIRNFAKVEPSNGEAASEVQQDRIQRQPEVTGNDSDDSDEGIQYLAPDQTLAGKSGIPIFHINKQSDVKNISPNIQLGVRKG
jgi:hypothetical protein